MKIAETFMFSEEYEKELLLLKCILSNTHIHEWVICENAYSHQGDFKGFCVKKIIETDSRFLPYKNKITVLEANKQFSIVDKSKFQDDLAFKCENWQRNLAQEYFINNYEDDDWLIVHDVDEMIDFSNGARTNELLNKLQENTSGLINVPRLRYWFDFDNQYKILYDSTLCTKKYLTDNPAITISYLKSTNNVFKEKGWKQIIAFEYSSCYGFNAIMRKLETTAHTWYKKEDLEAALRNNHKLMKPLNIRKYLRPNKYCFFEVVTLNEHNSPFFVRENIETLKSNVINPNYQLNRKLDYPQFYNLSYTRIYLKDNLKRAKVKISKKFIFLLRRLNIVNKHNNK
ncbi:MAG: hypothetical protein WAU24_14835 [Chitinophagaceae bacterium]